jgi:hypothetical protein
MEDLKSPQLRTGRNANLKLTSIKIHETLSDRVKTQFIITKLNMQKLVNRSLDLYLNDIDFRNKIHMHTALSTSGSL